MPLSNDGWFNAIALWGHNKTKDHEGESAFLLEGSWRKKRFAFHGRYEFGRSLLTNWLWMKPFMGMMNYFPVNALTVGFNYDLLNIGKTRSAGRSQFTLYSADSKLNTLYGKAPMPFQLYLRLYPVLMKM